MSRKPKCPKHGVELQCPVCEGEKGRRAAARKINPEQFREWGKRGGRPRKRNHSKKPLTE